MTGIGGFLQEFLYGYSGLRWLPTSVGLNPSMAGQLSGIVLRGLSWRGRQFTVSIGSSTTTVTVTAGRGLVLSTPTGRRVLNRGHSLVIPTRRPDRTVTTDAVRCGRASATSSVPGAPPLAAVDGSTATAWQPSAIPATVTIALPIATLVRTATVRWGPRSRASSYTLQVSQDGVSWRTVAAVAGRTSGSVDAINFVASDARFLRVQITAATGTQLPLLNELTVSG